MSTEQAIFEAASRLFEQLGYKKTTIDDIAQEAGVGKGTVYLRFSSKEELGMAWLAHLHGSLAEQLETYSSNLPSEQIVERLIKRVMLRFDISTRHRRSFDEALCTLRDQVEEKKRIFHEQEAQAIAELIRRGISEGSIISADPISDARTMILATNSLLPYNSRPERIGDRSTVESQAASLARLLVRAVKAKNA